MADITFEELKKTLTSKAETVGKRTEEFFEIQKEKAQILSAHRELDKDFRDLGEILYHHYAGGEEVPMEAKGICQDIDQLLTVIGDLKEDLAAKKDGK